MVAYGDMRFTDTHNETDTNPRVRKWLVDRIAEEKPEALFVSGDLPFQGGLEADWQQYQLETAPWRAAHLRVYPTLGNHEIRPDKRAGLANYFQAFPELSGHQWYSVQIGSVYLIALDSIVAPCSPGSPQRQWLEAQMAALPPEVDFVFIMQHMPLLNDVQTQVVVGLPNPEQVELRNYIEEQAHKSHAKFVVITGHIHNYERFEHAGVSYIISGGGGALPYPIFARGKEDLYQDESFPNYNYVVLDLQGKRIHATMYRVVDPKAPTLTVEPKDIFSLDAK